MVNRVWSVPLRVISSWQTLRRAALGCFALAPTLALGQPTNTTPVIIGHQSATIATSTGAQTQVTSTIIYPDAADPDRAFDPLAGQNFHWDAGAKQWVNSQTGQSFPILGYLSASQPGAFAPIVLGHQGATIATSTGAQTQVTSTIIYPDAADPNRAFDPLTGQNFHWDADTKQWVNSQTGQASPVLGYVATANPAVAPVRAAPPANASAPPPAAPPYRSPVSMSGFTPQFQLRAFGGAGFIHGNSPATAGFDGAVLFPLGNGVLVGPTAGFQWINSSIVKTIGSQQPGSTFINTAAGFKSGTFGAQIQIPFTFFHPTGVVVDIRAGVAVANSTITQAEGFCGLGNATSPAGCQTVSKTRTHDTVSGPFLGGYISHSIFPHVGVFAGYDYLRLKDTTSAGTIDVHYSMIVGGVTLTFGGNSR